MNEWAQIIALHIAYRRGYVCGQKLRSWLEKPSDNMWFHKKRLVQMQKSTYISRYSKWYMSKQGHKKSIYRLISQWWLVSVKALCFLGNVSLINFLSNFFAISILIKRDIIPNLLLLLVENLRILDMLTSRLSIIKNVVPSPLKAWTYELTGKVWDMGENNVVGDAARSEYVYCRCQRIILTLGESQLLLSGWQGFCNDWAWEPVRSMGRRRVCVQ